MSPSRRCAIGAVRGFASCPSPCPVARSRGSCPVAVGRDVPIAPPLHWRGARLGIPLPSPRAPPRALRSIARVPLCAPRITPAHYPCGAMVGRRASRLAPYRHYAPGGAPSPAKFSRTAPSPRTAATPLACPVVRSRCGRARCLAAPLPRPSRAPRAPPPRFDCGAPSMAPLPRAPSPPSP